MIGVRISDFATAQLHRSPWICWPIDLVPEGESEWKWWRDLLSHLTDLTTPDADNYEIFKERLDPDII